MDEAPTFQRLLEKVEMLKQQLESRRTREEKLIILTEFRFLLDAVDEILRNNPSWPSLAIPYLTSRNSVSCDGRKWDQLQPG